MRIARIKIDNFRGIAHSELLFSKHNVLVGDNNTGKSTILEAIDLVLGPERLSRFPVIDEHDFYAGEYLDKDGHSIPIEIEIIVSDLNEEQQRHFIDHIEWWDNKNSCLLESPPAEKTNEEDVCPALRVGFKGLYDNEEDNFAGITYFMSPIQENGEPVIFKQSDKRICGFLYLRTLRTGSRALSFEKGSLLDIVLKLQDKRLKMWEDVLGELRILPVAESEELGIKDILTSVQNSIQTFLPSDGGENPHIRVSDLTRENLRKILTVFMDTGAVRKDGTKYAAPFQHQGTGTINILVLALLSLIAELKQNVIFAMEEPEIAIPPHTQKSIIESICKKSAQALFTSHSPYVLEEFDPSEIIVLHKNAGILTGIPADFPPKVKPKAYRMEFRSRFCESLLARRVLIAEGRTEYDAFPATARRLHDLHPDEFSTLEALGISIINAETDSQIAPLGDHFKKLGKVTFAVFDKQEPIQKSLIEASIHHIFEAPEKNIESNIIKNTKEIALLRFALELVKEGNWPTHLSDILIPQADTPIDSLKDVLLKYLEHTKGSGGVASLLEQCTRDEMPTFIVETLAKIQNIVKEKISIEDDNSPLSDDLPSIETVNVHE
jgi:putative ATP-dependent endonuclease of OLD family